MNADGSTITFDLLQCPATTLSELRRTACLHQFIDFQDSRGNGLDARRFRVGERVEDRDGINVPDSYRITSEELARLLSGEAPADDAPDGFVFDTVDTYVVTVRNGVATAAEQILDRLTSKRQWRPSVTLRA